MDLSATGDTFVTPVVKVDVQVTTAVVTVNDGDVELGTVVEAEEIVDV